MKKHYHIIALLLLALTLNYSLNDVAASKQIKSKINLKYNNLSKRQTLNVYYPQKKHSKAYPVVLFLHGGYYEMGSKTNDLKKNKKNFTEAGYAYVSMNYRLTKEAKFPGAANDVKTAIRYLKTNAKKLSINPNKIFIIGHSAGANLGSLIASTPGISSFDDEKILYSKVNNRIAGFIGVSGFYNLESFLMIDDYQKKHNNNPNGAKEFLSYEEASYIYSRKRVLKHYQHLIESKNSGDLSIANTFNYLDNIKVPILLVAGKKDTIIGYQQTAEFCNALKKHKKKVTCRYYKNKSHLYKSYQKKSDYQYFIKWLNKQKSKK